jgi:hypothetical protein
MPSGDSVLWLLPAAVSLALENSPNATMIMARRHKKAIISSVDRKGASMIIALPPDIENALAEQARKRGTTPERLVLDTLREQWIPGTGHAEGTREPLGDEWEALLLRVGSPAGISLSDDATSRESLYE